MSDLCAQCAANAMKEDKASQRLVSELNRKEKRLINLLLDGAGNQEIAETMATSVQVTKNRLRMIFNKVGCDTRLELAMFVMTHPALLFDIRKIASAVPATAIAV